MKYLIYLSLLCFISCASTPYVTVKVSRFNPKKYVMNEEKRYFAWINKMGINPIEFESITSKFNKQLRSHGFYEVENPDDATYFFSFNAFMDSGKTEIYSKPIIGQTGVSSTQTYGKITGNSYSATTYANPSYGVVGTTVNSETIYTRTLEFSIERKGLQEKEAIYFARAISKGSINDLGRLIPYLLNSIFENMNENVGNYDYEIAD